MNKDELVREQASIREIQRDRIDRVHATCHEVERDFYRATLRGQEIDPKLSLNMQEIHKLTHAFMRGMDEAILIHEAIAKLEGRDPKEVTSALWSVRSGGRK